MEAVLLVQVAATLVMTGVAWFVQVVHYPLMARVPRDGLAAYDREHARRTTWVVAPAMAVEAATALALVARVPAGVPAALPWAGLGALVVVWASTWLLQVPCHRALARDGDPAVVGRLVRTSWLRTAAWTARAGLVLAMAGLTTAG